jgi:hypothetical protein
MRKALLSGRTTAVSTGLLLVLLVLLLRGSCPFELELLLLMDTVGNNKHNPTTSRRNAVRRTVAWHIRCAEPLEFDLLVVHVGMLYVQLISIESDE